MGRRDVDVLYFMVRWLLPPESEAIAGGKEAGAARPGGPRPDDRPAEAAGRGVGGLLLFWATEGKLHGFDTASITYVGLVVLMLPRWA